MSIERAAAFSILSFISAEVSLTFTIENIPSATATTAMHNPSSPSAGTNDNGDVFSVFEISSSIIIFYISLTTVCSVL